MYQKCKQASMLAVAMLVNAAYAAAPLVSNVTMTQVEHTRNVRITYDLAVTNAVITLAIETNGVALPDEAVITLTGEINKEVVVGTDHEIIWRAGEDWMGNVAPNARALITAWAKDNPPQYCVVDLSSGHAATNYPVKYYISSNAVPRSITDEDYKTLYVLLRRIDTTDDGGFFMGSPSDEQHHNAEREERVQFFLTKPFYIGIYQLTQRQWFQVMNTWPSRFKVEECREARPVDTISYNMIRGDTEGAKWPGADGKGDHSVDTNSFLGVLRGKTCNILFDLPTEAQWEYACRAGTTGEYNVDASFTLWGRHKYSGGTLSGSYDVCPDVGGTMYVGTYLPNAWGLYDMHGNTYEYCLDWRDNSPNWHRAGGRDPVGAVTGTHRIIRGGRYSSTLPDCRSAARSSVDPSTGTQYPDYGFRLALHLP